PAVADPAILFEGAAASHRPDSGPRTVAFEDKTVPRLHSEQLTNLVWHRDLSLAGDARLSLHGSVSLPQYTPPYPPRDHLRLPYHLCQFILKHHLATFNAAFPKHSPGPHKDAKVKVTTSHDDFSTLKEFVVVDIC